MDEILINIILVSAGITMLYFGATWLVSGSVSIAQKFDISKMIIGLTIVSFATSSPELTVTLSAALGGFPDVMIGNVVGSNITNVGLVLGVLVIMKTIPFQKAILKRDIPIMLGVSILFAILSLEMELSRFDGLLLVAGLVLFLFFNFKRYKLDKDEHGQPYQSKTYSPFRSIAMVLSGMALLITSSFITVDNAVVIAKFFGVSELVIGITLLAFGTSIPELVTNVIAIRRGQFSLSIGNIVGSNIFNILAIAGTVSIVTGITINPDLLWSYLVMILFGMILFFMGLKRSFLSKLEGSVLLGGYLLFVVFLFIK